jgi:two-component system sensor histidine kinase KdpD
LENDIGILTARRDVRAWAASLLGIAAITLAMFAVRPELDKAHVALLYLLVVLVGSAAGGRSLGLCLAGLAFLLFDALFLPPYHTLVIANPLDWLVLVTFLVTSVVAAQLLTRAQERAREAHARTTEIERLSALGAETLNVSRPEDALGAIAEVIRSTLEIETCDMYVAGALPGSLELAARAESSATRTDQLRSSEDVSQARPPDVHSLIAWTLESGQATVERLDGTLGVATAWELRGSNSAGALTWQAVRDARAIAVPLRVRERMVGVLRISNDAGIDLAPAQRDFLNALSYYAALGIERMRLSAEASHTEALREADRLKNALLAAVSHDLRTPLTTIKALAHSISERGALPGGPETASIEEEVDRLTALVSDLLDLSRLTGGAIQFRPSVNVADDLVGAALRRAQGVLADRVIHVIADRGQPVLLGNFDFVHTLRALVNLIENAAKYSPVTESIELEVRREGDRLVFAVVDRGIGVHEVDAERIFEPFYRPSGVAADVRGVGLGLAIARALARGQGGDVTYSPRDGGGSVFLLSVPATNAPVVSPE